MEPLASKIRPKSLEEYVGQSHLVGEGMPLNVAMKSGHVFSFLLWGPPGVGKTTLARIYANSVQGKLYELSAVSAGKDDIRNIINDHSLRVGPKILFLDEIHRFNKAQQDYLLPHVEKGNLVLIGATTENPSFEVIPALLSRCRIFVLKEPTDEEMKAILKRTGIKVPKDAQEWLIRMANGDSRQAITVLENAEILYGKITLKALQDTVQNTFIRYDKKGEEHYNVISAYIKSLRASQPNAALYYLARMLEAGEDPKFIARRMVIFASEDIGMAQPTALVVANEVFRAVEIIGMPEAAINLAHGTVHMCMAPKDRTAYDGYFEALADVQKLGNLPVPLEVRNAPTKLMKDIGYNKGYNMYTDKDFLPEKIKNKKYYKGKKKQ